MRRIIYNPAAESGGALTVLNNYHRKALTDTTCKSIFVTSVVKLSENENVTNIQLPWVKKSWFHRLFCDYIYMPRIIRKINADEVLSLQNIAVPFCRVKQTVYVQNAIPFTDVKFRLSEDRRLWLYQNIIGRMAIMSLKKVDRIIVQTKWMKEAVVEKCHISNDLVQIQRVELEQPDDRRRKKTDEVFFFFPATAFSFKNHQVIINAVKLLKELDLYDYKVIFTIDYHEKGIAGELYKQVKKFGLPIEFVGNLNQIQMCEYYRKSILLFPSFLETVGLPLLEAKMYDCRIIAADCIYAHDAIGDYDKCVFFKWDDANSLHMIMKEMILGKNE